MKEVHKIDVLVTSKLGETDPEWRAYNLKLQSGDPSVNLTKVSRLFELWIEAESREEAKEIAGNASEVLLANPVYQSWEILEESTEMQTDAL